ncbi:EamA family transporter [Aestuariispira insulae]|uniref:EamA-like transporter family protein n=1 Tax=Aestuariispira insulae TaxID=1461337 RepID=A0A3D9HXU4_9PROT|nr:EamA family transporter [Aestuariispira insulae]RED54327.1 EamA-like transporter family protein [Aestuariispira insulae]
MTLTVTLILLISAVVHASWNALLKVNGDRVAMLAVMYGTMGVICAAIIPFTAPMTAAAWAWLVPAALLHVVYKLGLIKMYEHGDLSLAYPVARGVAPVAVLILALLLAGEEPTANQLIGVGLVCIGLMGFISRKANATIRGLGYAALTGLIIAAYTVFDGMGVRAVEQAATFAAWVLLGDGLGTVALGFYFHGRKLPGLCRDLLPKAVPAGAIAGLAYGGVLWGLGQANMGGVSAIRESSVVFAALIGTLLMGEPMGTRRIAASVIVVVGIVILSWPA